MRPSVLYELRVGIHFSEILIAYPCASDRTVKCVYVRDITDQRQETLACTIIPVCELGTCIKPSSRKRPKSPHIGVSLDERKGKSSGFSRIASVCISY